MRSSTFIILSLIIHVIAVAAVALAPQHTIEPSGGEIEVSTGTQEAAPAEKTTEPAPAPKVEKAKPVEKLKPAATPVVKKSAPKKAAVVAEKTPVVEQTEEPAELPAKEEVAQEPVKDEQLSPVVEDIKEDPQTAAAEAPAAKEDTKTEAAAVEANPPAPEPAPTGAGEGDLGQGGATKEQAVSYTELKQDKGNKNPIYPLKARKENRQGEVDLVYRVTKDGRVTDVQIAKSSGHADLDKAAVNAVSKFKFIPSQEGWAYHPVIFALKGDSAPLPSKLRTAGSEGQE
jgi:protein TonB